MASSQGAPAAAQGQQGAPAAAPRPVDEATYEVGAERSRRQYEAAREAMPGGVVKGAYYHRPFPLYLASGEGCYVTTLDGRRMLDFRGHHTAMIVGHGHPAVLAAVQEQVARGFALGGPIALELEFANELKRRVPSIERVRCACSGTEASLHVVRLVRGATGRTKIAKFEGAFHGSSDAVEISVAPPVDRAGPADEPIAVATVKGIPQAAADEVVVLPFYDRAAVRRILERRRDEIAAVFLDPRAGILPVDPDFVRFVREVSAELGLLMVLDEIVAFRLGYGGLQGLAGIRPDLTTFGKIVGGGFPMAAFGGRADLMDRFDPSGSPTGFSQSGTFSGHPVALAAGLATLRAMTPDAFAHLNRLGARLRDEANELFRRRDVVGQAVGNGSLFSIYFMERPPRTYREMRTNDAARSEQLFVRLVNEGILLSQGLTMNALSLPMADEHVDGFLGALEKALA